jgi:AcrR family transcriptional regulator
MSEAQPDKSPWGATRRGRHSQFPVKREAVLNAAAALMARSGYRGVSLAELADALNITKPTLYHYVGSKEELFAAIIARSQQATIDAFRAVAAEDTTRLEKLRRIMIAYTEIVNSDFGTCLIFANTADVGVETRLQIKARAREANALIYQALAEGVADGTLRQVDPAITLQTLFGALNWSPNWYRPTGRLTLREVAEQQADILLGGMRA